MIAEITFPDRSVPYSDFIRDLAAKISTFAKEDKDGPAYISQRKAEALYGKANVLRRGKTVVNRGQWHSLMVNSLRNHMTEKYHKKCQVRGWGEINRFTKKVPLRLHHIDGDPANDNEDNLQSLCPDRHALTDNFGSRGTGLAGRSKYCGKAK